MFIIVPGGYLGECSTVQSSQVLTLLFLSVPFSFTLTGLHQLFQSFSCLQYFQVLKLAWSVILILFFSELKFLKLSLMISCCNHVSVYGYWNSLKIVMTTCVCVCFEEEVSSLTRSVVIIMVWCKELLFAFEHPFLVSDWHNHSVLCVNGNLLRFHVKDNEVKLFSNLLKLIRQ